LSNRVNSVFLTFYQNSYIKKTWWLKKFEREFAEMVEQNVTPDRNVDKILAIS